MITTIYSNSSSIVTNITGTPPYIPNTGSLSQGMVRYNGTIRDLEVYDGQNWQRIGQGVSMDLSPEVQDILRWAQGKRQEESELDALCEQHPGVKAAREQLEIMRRLVKKESEKA